MNLYNTTLTRKSTRRVPISLSGYCSYARPARQPSGQTRMALATGLDVQGISGRGLWGIPLNRIRGRCGSQRRSLTSSLPLVTDECSRRKRRLFCWPRFAFASRHFPDNIATAPTFISRQDLRRRTTGLKHCIKTAEAFGENGGFSRASVALEKHMAECRNVAPESLGGRIGLGPKHKPGGGRAQDRNRRIYVGSEELLNELTRGNPP